MSDPSARHDSTLPLAAVGSAALGLAFIIGAIMGATGKNPPPMVLTVCIILGGLIELGIARGLKRGSREAWALGVAMHGVLAPVALFGLPALFRAGVPKGAAIGAVIALAVMFAVTVGEREKK